MSNDFSKMEEGNPRFAQDSAFYKSSPPSNFQKIIAELVGTYILIFAGCGAALVDRVHTLTIVGIAMVWGLVLVALIYALGHVSGAHFNPAVTIAFAATRRFPLMQDKGLEAIAWEFIISFILMFMISGAASDDRANKELSGVAIGVTLLSNVLIAGPITGASMNPARSIGPALVSGVYKNLWVFIVAPILGATAAALTYSLLLCPRPGKNDEITKSSYNDLYLRGEA